MKLQLGKRLLNLDHPKVMGILNVTPDSFSDGGRFLDAQDALRQAAAMIDAGADIIDVGGESTRPGSDETPYREEIGRVIPVIKAIISRFDTPVSVDTSKPEVMCSAVEAGASMINDVFALRREGALDASIGLGVPVCLVHMQGTPRSMQTAPEYAALPGDVIDFLVERVEACVAAGLRRDLLVVDPGFGFGKTDRHNLEILAKLRQFEVLGLPLLVGLSRKYTLGKLTGRANDQRAAAGVAAAVLAIQNGANIIRTHDVADTVDALKIVTAVKVAG